MEVYKLIEDVFVKHHFRAYKKENIKLLNVMFNQLSSVNAGAQLMCIYQSYALEHERDFVEFIRSSNFQTLTLSINQIIAYELNVAEDALKKTKLESNLITITSA
jgi:hypothetical protein